jgi:hypothetical protein
MWHIGKCFSAFICIVSNDGCLDPREVGNGDKPRDDPQNSVEKNPWFDEWLDELEKEHDFIVVKRLFLHERNT